MTVLVDTNLFVRVLVGAAERDDPRLLRTAEALFGHAERGDLNVTPSEAVVSEVVWVMTSYYKADRGDVTDGLTSILSSQGCVMPTRHGCIAALRVWRDTSSLSFVDALLTVTAERSGRELATRDEKLARYSTASIWTPELD